MRSHTGADAFSVAAEPETRRSGAVPDPALLRYGGFGAVLSGVLFLLTIAYTFGFLFPLGLSFEMLDEPARLLPWIYAHGSAYRGLWWLYFLSLLFLLPAPIALAEALGRGGAALRIATAAGIGGVVVGLVAPTVNLASAPLLAADFARTADEGVLLLSRLAGDSALYLRLVSDLLVGIWLGLAGGVFLRRGFWRTLGWVQIGTAALVVVILALKPLARIDGEPFLGFLLALVYLWLGAMLLRASRLSSGDGLPGNHPGSG